MPAGSRRYVQTLACCVAALAFTAVASAPLARAAAPREPNAPVLLRVPNDPTISFRLWFKVGAQNDPAGKEGLAALTASMVSEAATKKNSYEAILDKLFPLASDYRASASMEMTVLHGRTHKDNLADYYPLFLDAVLAPAFEQRDLDRLRSRTLNFLENQLRFASDEELGKAVLYNDVFAGTPYGHLVAGTIGAVKSITLDDIKAFHAAHYTRDNVVIGLGGGFDDALLNRLKADLAQLPAGRPPVVPPPQPKAIEGLQFTLIEKQAGSTAISLGHPIDVLRGSREWYALAIANSWLGEHRNTSARLFQVIRDKRGLNYGDYSYIEHYPNGGQRMKPPQNVPRRRQLFEVWIRPVPHEARHFALRAALREVQMLVDQGMSREAFDTQRAFLKKYVLHYAPTTNERLGYALDDAFYGLDESHLVKFRRMMDDVTLEEVNAALKKHWQTANLRVAIITQDAGKFADDIVADRPSPITYSSPKPPEILEEDKAIAAFPLKVTWDRVKIVPVAELFVK